MTPARGHVTAAWPVARNVIVDVLDHQRPHSAHGFGEVRFSRALAAIEHCRRRSRTAVSVHAFLLACLARAAAEHPAIVTYRHRRKLVRFADVDVATMLEKRLPDGTRIAVAYTFRAADRRSLAEINWEMRAASRRSLNEDPSVRYRRRIAGLPGFVRRLVFRRIMTNPFRLRQVYGTLAMSTIRTPEVMQPVFTVPPNMCTASITIGSVTQRFLPDTHGQPVLEKVLCVGGSVDHDIVDGMVMMRFCRRFAELVESAAGLDDTFIAQTAALRAGVHDQTTAKVDARCRDR